MADRMTEDDLKGALVTTAKDALALVRNEVVAALQCATDDHTKYHLSGVPGMLDDAEAALIGRESKLLGGNRVLTQKIAQLKESAQRQWESLHHYVETRTEQEPCGFCGSWGEHDNDSCDLVAAVTALEEDFGCGEHWRGETIPVEEPGESACSTDSRYCHASDGQVEALKAAILRIARTPVYEERGNPASGISVAMVGAISEARGLVQ